MKLLYQQYKTESAKRGHDPLAIVLGNGVRFWGVCAFLVCNVYRVVVFS